MPFQFNGMQKQTFVQNYGRVGKDYQVMLRSMSPLDRCDLLVIIATKDELGLDPNLFWYEFSLSEPVGMEMPLTSTMRSWGQE